MLINIRDMTYEELKQAHIELWTWIIKSNSRQKIKWPGWNKYTSTPIHACFACVAAKYMCLNCPCDWKTGKRCTSIDGYYNKWFSSNNICMRKHYASKILKAWR